MAHILKVTAIIERFVPIDFSIKKQGSTAFCS